MTVRRGEIADFRQSSVNPGNFQIWWGTHVFGLQDDTHVACHTLYALPFYTGVGGLLQSVAFRLKTQDTTSSTARIALYERGGAWVDSAGTSFDGGNPNDLYPNRLLLDCGTFAISANPSNTTITAAISYTMPACEMIWVAFVAHETPDIFTSQVARGAPSNMGAAMGTTPTADHYNLQISTFSYDTAWPLAFPSSAVPTGGAGQVPLVAFLVTVP